MPATKARIEQLMKMENNPLVYLEYTPKRKLKDFLNPKNLFNDDFKKQSYLQYCMGYISRPYENTYRITTCRHLVTNRMDEIPSKADLLKGLEVFIRFEGVDKKMSSLMLEDVNIKVHEDELVDLLFIEITRPADYNFQLLNQAAQRCRRRFPGSQVYYFQNFAKENYFRLFEGVISREKIYITGVANNGYLILKVDKPEEHHRAFHIIETTKKVFIKGASGSPILSRRAEVVGMICAHEQTNGRGIYLSVETIESLYDEIGEYHV